MKGLETSHKSFDVPLPLTSAVTCVTVISYSKWDSGFKWSATLRCFCCCCFSIPNSQCVQMQFKKIGNIILTFYYLFILFFIHMSILLSFNSCIIPVLCSIYNNNDNNIIVLIITIPIAIILLAVVVVLVVALWNTTHRKKEGNVLINTFCLSLFAIRHGKGPLSERGNPLPSLHGLLFSISTNGIFYIHLHTHRIKHTTAFITPVVEDWLNQEIAQWVHHEGSIRQPIA